MKYTDAPYRWLIGLTVSVLAHVFLIGGLEFSKTVKLIDLPLNKTLNSTSLQVRHDPVLQVVLSIRSVPTSLRLNNLLHADAVKRQQELDSFYASANIVPRLFELVQNLPLAPKVDTTAVTQSGTSASQNYYFKPSEVDISAIPMHSLQLTGAGVEGLIISYQLRIYINKDGHVNKIENLKPTAANSLFYSELEEQLKTSNFIPAKKNGLTVDSYIDVILESNTAFLQNR